MEMSSNEAIKQAVQAGLGLGILSLQTLEQELTLQRLAVLAVEDFPIMRHWYVVHRIDKRLSPVSQAFKTFVLQPVGNRTKPLRHTPNDCALSDRRPERPVGQRARIGGREPVGVMASLYTRLGSPIL